MPKRPSIDSERKGSGFNLTSHALAVALTVGAVLGQFERNRAEVERLASDAIELSTRQNFATWLPATVVLRGWARSALGDLREGIEWIVDGLRDMRAAASLTMPFMLALKSEALYLAGRTPDALEAIEEAEALAERSDERWWCAELHRLHGVFLAAIGADEAQIEGSFCGHQHRKGAEVDSTRQVLAREARRSNLCGIPSPKSERFKFPDRMSD